MHRSQHRAHTSPWCSSQESWTPRVGRVSILQRESSVVTAHPWQASTEPETALLLLPPGLLEVESRVVVYDGHRVIGFA